MAGMDHNPMGAMDHSSMGQGSVTGMDHAAMGHGAMAGSQPMAGHDMGSMDMGAMNMRDFSNAPQVKSGPVSRRSHRCQWIGLANPARVSQMSVTRSSDTRT